MFSLAEHGGLISGYKGNKRNGDMQELQKKFFCPATPHFSSCGDTAKSRDGSGFTL
jgi:hypothetical protein